MTDLELCAGAAQVFNRRGQQESTTNSRGVTMIIESGIFQAYFTISRFRNDNGVVTSVPPPGEPSWGVKLGATCTHTSLIESCGLSCPQHVCIINFEPPHE